MNKKAYYIQYVMMTNGGQKDKKKKVWKELQSKHLQVKEGQTSGLQLPHMLNHLSEYLVIWIACDR